MHGNAKRNELKAFRKYKEGKNACFPGGGEGKDKT